MELGSRLSLTGCAYCHGAKPALALLPPAILVTAYGGSLGASVRLRDLTNGQHV